MRGGSRPNSGRKRKDPALKLLAGTQRADRELELPEAVAIGKMVPPMHLGDLEQLTFGSIAAILEQQGRASPHFAEHVALLSVRLSQIQRLKAVLEVEGDTFTTEKGMVRARPEVAMLSDAMRQAQSLLAELMLNPSAALRLASGEKPPAGEFDDF